MFKSEKNKKQKQHTILYLNGQLRYIECCPSIFGDWYHIPSINVLTVMWLLFTVGLLMPLFRTNGEWACIFRAFPVYSKSFTLVKFTHSHTLSYSDGRGCHSRCQLLIMSNLGFSILLKDTSRCRLGEAGIRPSDPPPLTTAKNDGDHLWV